MAPPDRGGTQDGADKYKTAPDAKHLLDMIGKDVYDQVKKDGAETYDSYLKGNLTRTTFFGGETVAFSEPCGLIKEKRENLIGASGKRHPCKKDGKGEDVSRFSKESGGECDDKKIKGNKGKEGACAPYRRLSLCNKNFPNMNSNDSSKAKNDLLLDVCLAAKFEGESLINYRAQYDAEYPSSGSTFTMCTMLARSFADIGDIIRGKDLYLGNKKKNKTETERDKLEQKLKEIFENIKKSDTKLTNLNDDQIREYWWALNREDVWKAITCNADASSAYFRPTCSMNGSGAQARNKCRCEGANAGKGSDGANVNIVPTYFDYVPQFLRWFEEWAEDFCRKKKKKVENLEKQCRGEDGTGNERYCSGNGYDCKGTFRAKNKYRWDYKCTGCFLSCSHFRTWIDNQRKQFDKQKKKYDEEMQKYTNGAVGGGSSRKKRDAGGTTNYDGYIKKFYGELKNHGYGDVNNFLEKLSNEDVCKRVEDDKGGKINFKNVDRGKHSSGDGSNKTFSHTEYCQACPWCGVKEQNGTWERKDNTTDCPSIKLYKPKKDAEATPINFLYSGEGETEIKEKLEQFCTKTQNGGGGSGDCGGTNSDSSLCEPWQCYHVNQLEKDPNPNGVDDPVYENDVQTGGGLCILKNQKKNKKEVANTSEKDHDEMQKTFNNFFYYWVVHMLKDSIYWRTKKIKKCLENGKTMKCKEWCNKDCVCFQKWIDKKEKEWDKIKDHFKKQKGFKDRGVGLESGVYVLEYVLELEFSNENSTKDAENKVSAEEAKEIQHLRDIIKKKNQQEPASGVGGTGSANGQKTLMDKLIEYERGIATKCQKDCKDPPQQESPLRSAEPRVPTESASDDNLDNGSEDEEEEDEEEEDEGDEEQEVPKEAEKEPKEEETTKDSAPPPKVEVNPCDIVNTLFTSGDNNALKDACSTKYVNGREKFPNWKCISDTATGKSDGSICVPPRRRRLYIGRLTQWAEEATKSLSPQGSTSPSPSHSRAGDLLKAFVESAAVETFFLWDRYKKENTKTQSVGSLPLINGDTISDEQNPEKMLQSGNIPPDFLRQMFYTLGDYRDICIGDENVIKALEASGDNTMKKINDKIKENLSKQPGTPPGKPNAQTPKDWWEQHGKDIWHGMVCALTYTDSEAKGQTPTQDVKVKEAFFGKDNKAIPVTTSGTTSGKYKEKYEYGIVKLEEEEASGAKTNNDQPPTLKNFVERPPYFRYLEEWGQNFCKERKKRLKQIYEDCRGGEYTIRHNDGDGFNCEQIVPDKDVFLGDFIGSSCATSCSFYKKWIKKKRTEYEKQQNAYAEQREKAQKNNGYNGFCGTLQKFTTAGDFLQKLGSCKTNKQNGEDEIKFDDKDSQTFKHTEYCKPCSLIGVKYKNGVCNVGPTKGECNGETITADAIGKMDNSTVIDMLVSDKNTKEFKGGLEACQTSGVFEGIRKDVWKCGNLCKSDVCVLENFNEDIHDKKNVLIRTLFKRWLQYFLQDYIKINAKFSHCTNNGEGFACKNKCKDKCKCVEHWINQKRTEWDNIKKRFLDQYKYEGQPDYPVTSFLQDLIPRIALTNDKKLFKTLNEFLKSYACNCTENSKESKKDENNDLVLCLLDKLGEKAKTCAENHTQNSVENQAQTCQESTPPDDDEPLEEENPVTQPNICPPTQAEPETVEKDTCEEAPTELEETAAADGERQTPKEEAPAQPAPRDTEKAKPPPKPPRVKPQQPGDDPWEPLKNAMLSSTIMWSIGIGFATFTYFYLKKKTKSPVGNLFQILQIPKGDYDIPTKLSPNRYIPYTSGKYRGKRYIYLEGDSGTDSGYTDHYSDITSSESEYEEMDINDIYVPGSPKYKTLIEVVLEPSKRDIQSDDTPINKFTDDEWNQLKHDFISNMLQNTQNTEPNILGDNVDNNTNPKTLHVSMEEKPFIMSIHDRNLYTGEEYSYDMSTNSGNNDLYNDNHDSHSGTKDPYSGTDLINDALSGNKHIDIYDELLKRKENELFGTNHTKHTTTNIVAKPARDYLIHNQLELFHKWLDRHRYMCEKWSNKEELLDKLKEEWNNENNTNSSLTHTSNIPSGENSIKNVLNTDVSIQIDMDNPKTKNEFKNIDTTPNKSTMDTILEDLDKTYNEPYYDVQDDIYYDVNDDKTSVDHINMDYNKMDSNNMDVPSKVKIEMNIVNNKKDIFEEEYPMSDIWNI
ncbi:erythrocyte membrane protein 1 [Plasmodium falciparum IGH-CR14]|uniref:Erythrocyte membrane protein 1 n=1 Tax=Plasmodium falciparum IGH-CR14 TaxID=580059 RepID=A0A0L1I311_PLAFA|nr:erythrocyte membrane protein 1 [Plasmodium falciparum IGH-CR14]